MSDDNRFVEEHFDIDAGLNIIQIQDIKLDLVLVINAQEIENPTSFDKWRKSRINHLTRTSTVAAIISLCLALDERN